MSRNPARMRGPAGPPDFTQRPGLRHLPVTGRASNARSQSTTSLQEDDTHDFPSICLQPALLALAGFLAAVWAAPSEAATATYSGQRPSTSSSSSATAWAFPSAAPPSSTLRPRPARSPTPLWPSTSCRCRA